MKGARLLGEPFGRLLVRKFLESKWLVIVVPAGGELSCMRAIVGSSGAQDTNAGGGQLARALFSLRCTVHFVISFCPMWFCGKK